LTVAATLTPKISDELPPEPYPGLRPFERSEWAIFFGREQMTEEVIARLAKQHLVMIHGASGCGKSSLVRAGVLPWLDLDHARSGKAWATAIVRPSGGPLRNLARALAEALGPPRGHASSPAEAVAAWHDCLALGSSCISEIGQALELQGASLCLLVDQFEELFRYAKEGSREEVQLLIDIFQAVADPNPALPRLFIILTMRSDYLGECARFKGFAETVNPCQYLLSQLDDFALLRAIHEPAALYGGEVDPAVGDRLIFAARQEEDALPVLQHTLMRACVQARERQGSDTGWAVTVADLEAIEGRNGALSHHADEVLIEIGAVGLTKTAEWLFRSLTELDAEGRIIRRPRRLTDLVAVAGGDCTGVTAVIEAFRAAGRSFLVTNPPGRLEDDTEIDVSHEALVRHWRQLSDPTRDPRTNEPVGWLWREFEDGLFWRALAVQARVFRDDKSKGATLTPAMIASYERWWLEHTPAWAARYARDKDLAFEEYREVKLLWQASKRALELERARPQREIQAADEEALAVLRQGVPAWNEWRSKNLETNLALQGAELAGVILNGVDLTRVNLAEANLTWASLTKANFTEANLGKSDLTSASLTGANLRRANLRSANLTKADLSQANLSEADLSSADLSQANLSMALLAGANLQATNLTLANLTKADLSGANLERASLTLANLVQADLSNADLTGCRIYGVSAWGLNLMGAKQQNLVITDHGEPEITVDNVEVAQFIYLLLNNERIRHVIDSITPKVVLILGRWATPERKVVLDALREELRQRDYVPVLFDFDKPASKDLTESIQTLANMARFIIADLTDPSSIPHELAMVVPHTAVPVQPILLKGEREYAMFVDLRKRIPWVLKPYVYVSPERLIADLGEQVIVPAEVKARELRVVSPPR
jgi:uncharacterized protein YjbI with pentapeptide repeats